MIGRTISHYKIVDKLGEGGMGAVYKAEDTTLNRLVAIKALSSHLSENDEARERFVREAQAASSLNHSNITTVYELLEDGGEQFIVMEYVDGKTIRDMVESSHVSIRKAVDILIQAAEALEAAHNKGILHRDVKSANIMVSMEGNVKVMDFGLAHLEDRSQLTRTGTTMGTLAYSSPEQLVGAPVDRRSEIFSLGVVFYELLTGQLPFKSSSEGELVFEIINTEQDMLTTCREDVPENVCSVINKMLIKKPELRYQTCGELLTDLKAIRSELETTSIHLATDQLKKFRTRVPILSVGLLGFLGLVLVFSGLFKSPVTKSIRIAVLPFTNLGSIEDDYYVGGIIDELRTQIGDLDKIITLSRNSSVTYKGSSKTTSEIGNECHVEYLLTGTLRLLNPDSTTALIIITPELIRVSDDAQIWSDSFEAPLANVFTIQNTIKQEIISNLGLEIDLDAIDYQANSEIDIEAYSYYLRGFEYLHRSWGGENYFFAERAFKQAIEIDPDFALAYARLGRTHMVIYWLWYDRSEARRELAKQAIDKALVLDHDLPEAYQALGYYYYHGFLDYPRALEALEKALDLRPNESTFLATTGYVYRRKGEFNTALGYLNQAYDLDPRYATISESIGYIHLHLRNYREALQWAERAMSLTPDWSGGYITHFFAGQHQSPDLETTRSMSDSIFSQFSYRDILEFGFIPAEFLKLFRVSSLYHQRSLDRSIFEDSDPTWLPVYFAMKAEYARQLGDQELVVSYCDSILSSCTPLLQARPDEPALRCLMGLALAGLGDKDGAISYGLSAVEVMPIELEAVQGPLWVEQLAEIYTIVGEYEEAIALLDALLAIPSQTSVLLMRQDPAWAPLRNIPHFQEMLRKYN